MQGEPREERSRPYRFRYKKGGWSVVAGNGRGVADNHGHDTAEAARDGILGLIEAIKNDNFTVELKGSGERQIVVMTRSNTESTFHAELRDEPKGDTLAEILRD